MKSKAGKKKTSAPHPWEELSRTTGFSIQELRVLQEHHATLHRFCVDPEKVEDESKRNENGDTTEAIEQPVNSLEDGASLDVTTLDLSFEQYCLCLHTMIKYGNSTQQFEYLFQTYAIESERGISRAELYQLLQDHYHSPATTNNTQHKDKLGESATQARHFERLYTWLKKHVTLFDRSRCGYLTLGTTIEMLSTHGDALHVFRFQIMPFVKKMEENNKHYKTKAEAASIHVF